MIVSGDSRHARAVFVAFLLSIFCDSERVCSFMRGLSKEEGRGKAPAAAAPLAASALPLCCSREGILAAESGGCASLPSTVPRPPPQRCVTPRPQTDSLTAPDAAACQ